jgi:phosphohistidine phosphatase
VRAYLVRHGEAKREDVDPERHLTARGVEDVQRIATEAAEPLGVRPARIVHSGKARARQTAELWADVVGAEVAETDGLSPNDDPSEWATRLNTEEGDIMLVGHLPHLERLVCVLVTGDADRAVAGFPPGGLVCVERSGSGWDVVAVRQ